MRTSNKILLGLFLTAVFLFAGLFIAVRVNFANGNIADGKGLSANPWSDKYRIKEEIKSVSISGQMDMNIIPSDSAMILIGKMGDSLVRYRIKDGVLLIDIDSARMHARHNEGVVVYNHITLYLPSVDSIHVVNSRIGFKNIANFGTLQPAYNFHLVSSELSVAGGLNNSKPVFYDKIKVVADNNSFLSFPGNARVNDVQVRLSGSRFEDGESYFGKLHIQLDSSSSINIKGNNLRKATITSTE